MAGGCRSGALPLRDGGGVPGRREEFLNCDLRAQISKRPDRREKGALKKTATSVMRSLQKKPERVASYFEADDIAYAA